MCNKVVMSPIKYGCVNFTLLYAESILFIYLIVVRVFSCEYNVKKHLEIENTHRFDENFFQFKLKCEV